MSIKISVITPSFNSGDFIERAIKSVLDQGYDNWEHIVVDGASTDNTLDILKQYDHLTWISEKDDGQVDAMNKGFAMATGDVMVYLNADDYFLDGAFSAVAEAFTPDVKMVVGKVHLYSEKDDSWWVNDPKVDFESMVRHWELNAFCYNPVGYFYRTEIQEEFPFNLENDDKQDLEFLLNVSKAYPDKIKKIDTMLGVYYDAMDTKTFKNQIKLNYWRPENFKFVDDLIADKTEQFKADFQAVRECGYQLQTRWTISDAIRLGYADEAFANGDIIQLPCNEDQFSKIRRFGENSTLVAPGDSVVVILSAGKIGTQSLAHSLRDLPENIAAYPVYDLHAFGPSPDMNERIGLRDGFGIAHRATSLALRRIWDNESERLCWKFITGVREPVSWMISTLFQNSPQTKPLVPETFWEDCGKCWQWVVRYFDRIYYDILGVDVLAQPFDKQKGYSILNQGSSQVLMYTLEGLDSVGSAMIREYLGIQDFKLARHNVAANKHYKKMYKQTVAGIEGALDRRDLEQAYSHPLFRHFYTDEQVDKFCNRWAKKTSLPRSTRKTPVELQSYQMRFVNNMLEHVSITGKRVLEIGSDKCLAVARFLVSEGASEVQCSNMEDFAREIPPYDEKNVSFKHCDGRDLPFEDDSFDLVIGCALLEHVNKPELFAKELNRVVKPGGQVYMHGEPLWTGSKGHHIYYVGKDDFYKFNSANNPIPDFGHLTMDREELAVHLRERGIGEEDVNGIVHYVYDSDLVNRLSSDEISGAFKKYFTLQKVVRIPDEPYPAHVLEQLKDDVGLAKGKKVSELVLVGEKALVKARQSIIKPMAVPKDLVIVLCSGHRVGSTWINNIMLNMGINCPVVDRAFRPQPHMEMLLDIRGPEIRKYLEGLKGIQFFKSHSPAPEWLSACDSSKVRFVTVVRDPRDVVVSLSHYQASLPVENGGVEAFKEMSVKDRIKNILKYGIGELDLIESWLGLRGVHRIKYEDMLANSYEEMRSMFKSLGVPFEREELKKALDGAAFARMSNGRDLGEEDPSSFYRKGVAGDWQQYFDESVEKAFREELGGRWYALAKELGYIF